jgi:PAS domain S-box-containing protein
LTDVEDVGIAQDELVAALRTTVEQLRSAQDELSRQNDELASLQQAIAADARRMQLLFDAAPIAFLTTDRNGVVTEANAAVGTLLDLPARFLPGKPLAAFVDPSRRRTFRSNLLAVHAGSRLDLPMRMRRRDGVAFDARASAVAVGEEILWTIADQTLLAQAEEQVWQLNRELEERVSERTAEIEGLLEQLPVGVALVTRSGNVTWLNGRAQAIMGRRATRLDHLFADGATTPGGHPLERDEYPANRAQRGEHVRDVRMVTTRADGEPVTVEVSAAPLHSGGVVVVFDDATEQSRREESERRFVSNAAHQIRTPITIIASVVAALQAGGRDDPDALDRFISHIDGAVTRLAGLAEALLTLARIQRGAERPVEVVSLAAVVDEVVAGRDVELRLDPGVAAVADRLLLVEALSNVVDNAFVHGGGRVEVAARLEHGRIVVEVSDHGEGIPPDERARALERFGTSGRGTGLGLAIAQEAAAALGGELSLHDARGGGLLVRFELPGATLL